MSKTKKRSAPEDGAASQAKKQKKSKYQVDDTLFNMELGINESFAVMDNQLLADYLAQKLGRFGSDLSAVELSDLSLSGEHSSETGHTYGKTDTQTANAIADTTSWTKTRATEELPEFLEKFAEHPDRLGKAPSKKGTPHTIIVAGAGLRAANLVRYDSCASNLMEIVLTLQQGRAKVPDQGQPDFQAGESSMPQTLESLY